MSKSYHFVLLALTALGGGCTHSSWTSGPGPGQRALLDAFDPKHNFTGDLTPGTADELVLTVSAMARDDYAPAYSLAIAYRCSIAGVAAPCGFQARMLRAIDSLDLFAQSQSVRSASELRDKLGRGAIEWLEADVDTCPNGILAMDSIRVADWNPDIHYALQEVDDRPIILHPAAIRITMRGSITTTTYQGWVLASGAPTAVRQLIETLEQCWKPSTSRRPWERRALESSSR